ncbi:MAG: tetratricopeptide repeat protein [Candidatus Dadabacteria bacterium]|nr:tetratricopeptide repeat protein [Candidatus Dadabacteria bacterium]
MATGVKVTHKELKQLDRFRQFAADSIELAQRKYTNILLGVFGITIIIAGALYINKHKENKLDQANYKFYRAVVLKGEIDSEESATKALEKFSALIEEYPDTTISSLSLYYSALINYDRGHYTESINLFNRFISSEKRIEILKDLAYLTIGLANYNLGNWNETVEQLSKLDKGGSPYRKQARIHIALSYEKMGQQEKADEIYRDLLGEI